MELTDKEIIIKIRKGQIDAYVYLVKKYTGQIRNYAAERLFDKVEADDIVQNVFLSFYKAIRRFDEKRPVLPYLYEIVKNELKMYYRRHKSTLSLDDRLVNLPAREIFSDSLEEAKDFLRPLPEVQQKIMLLLTKGYSYQEIANYLNKPLNTVKTIIRRARLKLRPIYESA
jgi:RNA polymerase sigma-70 factor, ECF subfamily